MIVEHFAVFFCIIKAPNDEAIASVLYSAGSLGNVRTETLRAFSISEAAKVIEKS